MPNEPVCMSPGHYICHPVVIICVTLWSLFVSSCCHYLCHPMVIICVKLWSLSVSPCGHYLCHFMVIIYVTLWSLPVSPYGHYLCHVMVIICVTLIWSFIFVTLGDHLENITGGRLFDFHWRILGTLLQWLAESGLPPPSICRFWVPSSKDCLNLGTPCKDWQNLPPPP